MRTETPPTVRLEDYRPSDHLIDRVELDIRLDPHDTRVTATLALRPQSGGPSGARPSFSTETTSPCSP
jgi:aminopeptidase N